MRRALVAALLAACLPAHADDADFDVTCTSCQADFEAVSEDLAAALGYKALGPAEASGVTGIAVYAFGSYSQVANQDAWRNLTGSDVEAIGIAGVTLRKGLPFGIDLGAFYTAVPGTGASLYGAEARYAILPGGVATPAVALRGTYTRSAGIDDFDYEAWGADVSVSKGFTLLTPYVGAGVVRATADPSGAPPAAGLSETQTDATRIFAGVRLALGLFDIVPEYERVGSSNNYNLALGLSF